METLPLSHQVRTGPPYFSKLLLRDEPRCGWIQNWP